MTSSFAYHHLLQSIPQPGINGASYALTIRNGPLGLTLIDTHAGFCILSAPPEHNSQTFNDCIQGDFVTAVGGQSLAVRNYKGVKGLTKLLKRSPRPVVIHFFRFTSKDDVNVPPPPPKKITGPPPRHHRGISAPTHNIPIAPTTTSTTTSTTPTNQHNKKPPPQLDSKSIAASSSSSFYGDIAHTPVSMSIQTPGARPMIPKHPGRKHRKTATAPQHMYNGLMKAASMTTVVHKNSVVQEQSTMKRYGSVNNVKSTPPRRKVPPPRKSLVEMGTPKFDTPPPPRRTRPSKSALERNGLSSVTEQQQQQQKKKSPPPRKSRPSQVALEQSRIQHAKPSPNRPTRPSQTALSNASSLVKTTSTQSIADREKKLFERAAGNNNDTKKKKKLPPPKPGPKPAMKWGNSAKKKGQISFSSSGSSGSSGSNAYGFSGIPKDTGRGIRKTTLKKTQSAAAVGRPKASSVASRAAVFGGMQKKATTKKLVKTRSATSTHVNSFTGGAAAMQKKKVKVEKKTTSDVFSRSPFAKKVATTTASASITKSNSNSARSKGGKGGGKGGGGGGRLRGSSITAQRGTPGIVRRSLEQRQSAVQSVKVKTRYSFDAQAADELEIHTGDVVEIIKDEGDWWEGRLKGKTGIFPKSYAGDVFS